MIYHKSKILMSVLAPCQMERASTHRYFIYQIIFPTGIVFGLGLSIYISGDCASWWSKILIWTENMGGGESSTPKQ